MDTASMVSAHTPPWYQFLGRELHLRVLNKEKDFCYAILETVQYYLHQRQPAEDAVDPERSVDGGSLLIFRFVSWEDIATID